MRGEFLVHLRSPFKDLAPNCWDTRFGGHLKAGSDILQTVLQEAREEIGLELAEQDLIKGEVYKCDGKKK